MATHTAIPASDVLEKAAALNVFDQSGTEVTFGSLIEEQKTIVVFIRLFHVETAGFTYAMYADPTRALYTTFGLVQSLERTPAGQPKRSYVGKSFIANVLKSIWDGPLKNPQNIGKNGNISQLGGDFIFGPGTLAAFL
ncbi:Thioredoxin-like protein AAED1 [Trametes pubescens]|uniref:Thioredoxin-like protein AAED1 n=1 Tax=Trametes pubescens TaxID=154538 RepID=A0A1M2V4L4_TRAPU|nr:Thioredoxin-like protein AAED1 [Trametes pubescens]